MIIDKLVSEGKNRVDDLRDFITSLFGDTKEGETTSRLTLCTAHRSKGREWDRVYLLGQAAYMPSKWARKDWQMEQELNLIYVALTRAKRELVHIIV